MLKKAFLFLVALVMVALLGKLSFWLSAVPSEAKHLTIKLTRDTFTVFDFPSKKPHTSALLLFASGDGGWGNFEEEICHAFQNQGYETIGIDSTAYAKTDYDLGILQSDFSTIAQITRAAFGKHPPPLIVGGYSMGAAQAIAVAGGPHPPEGLVGLMLIDPCSRGRYGLRSSDQMDVLPTGPGTFSVDVFSSAMGSLRVMQWHAENDSIDSRAWLDSLTGQHKTLIFPHTGHDYEINRQNFILQLVESVGWILIPARDGHATAKTK